MAINGITSSLPDKLYIAALEKVIADMQTTIGLMQSTISMLQKRK